jgi:hypothetical protein
MGIYFSFAGDVSTDIEIFRGQCLWQTKYRLNEYCGLDWITFRRDRLFLVILTRVLK